MYRAHACHTSLHHHPCTVVTGARLAVAHLNRSDIGISKDPAYSEKATAGGESRRQVTRGGVYAVDKSAADVAARAGK